MKEEGDVRKRSSRRTKKRTWQKLSTKVDVIGPLAKASNCVSWTTNAWLLWSMLFSSTIFSSLMMLIILRIVVCLSIILEVPLINSHIHSVIFLVSSYILSFFANQANKKKRLVSCIYIYIFSKDIYTKMYVMIMIMNRFNVDNWYE